MLLILILLILDVVMGVGLVRVCEALFRLAEGQSPIPLLIFVSEALSALFHSNKILLHKRS